MSTITYVFVRGASNEYPQHMFSSRNKKNIMWIPPLICSYVKKKHIIMWIPSGALQKVCRLT